MPQLDINTYSFQYVSLIILFVTVYFFLSYFILPLILRSTIIRSNVSLKNQKSDNFLSKNIFGIKQFFNKNLLNTVFILNFLTVKSDTTNSLSNYSFFDKFHGTFSSYLLYVTLIVSEEENQ